MTHKLLTLSLERALGAHVLALARGRESPGKRAEASNERLVELNAR